MNIGDFSLTEIYQHADATIRAVWLALAACSVLGWAVILEKATLLVGLAAQTRKLEQADDAGLAPTARRGVVAAISEAAEREQARRYDDESRAERRQRLEEAMRDAMHGEFLRAERRLSYLATIGSTAPFIGLFGTVWGVMHAFSRIAQTNDTSLAVVAPGISEALATTAIGLLVAIPAAMAYNKLAGDYNSLARRCSLAVARLARRLD